MGARVLADSPARSPLSARSARRKEVALRLHRRRPRRSLHDRAPWANAAMHRCRARASGVPGRQSPDRCRSSSATRAATVELILSPKRRPRSINHARRVLAFGHVRRRKRAACGEASVSFSRRRGSWAARRRSRRPGFPRQRASSNASTPRQDVVARGLDPDQRACRRTGSSRPLRRPSSAGSDFTAPPAITNLLAPRPVEQALRQEPATALRQGRKKDRSGSAESG